MGAEEHRELIRRLYEGLDRHDGEAMAACYAPDATFSDPVFPDLRGEGAPNMWRMLTERSEDLSVELVENEADETGGRARWIARYTFSTGRAVVNDVRSQFRFAGGLIAEQRDEFSFWRWSRQALGPAGMLLGWSPILPAATRRRAAGQLRSFVEGDGGKA